MNKIKIAMVIAALGVAIFPAYAQKTYVLTSPDGQLQTTVAVGDELTFNIVHDGIELMAASPIAIERTDGVSWGPKARVQKASRTSVKSTSASPFYRKAEVIDDHNALTLKMKGEWAIEFRAYNDGIAYRFVSNGKKAFIIKDETADYRFPTNPTAAIPYVERGKTFAEQYQTSFENTYSLAPINELDSQKLAFLPLIIGDSETKICFTEVNLRNYPGMYLYNPDGENHIVAHFAPYPKETFEGGHNNLQIKVSEYEDFIAKIDNARTFPWRVAVVGTDIEIADSDLGYILAEPSKIEDTSWIRPGKVAWDWWNNWNIGNVDFEAGINNDTYKYYIDFASENGIEYVILDEGWAVRNRANLFEVVPEIDLKALVAHANSKGVGLILWAGYRAFERDMEEVCKVYSEMGIKGFKVDFMDRDDQIMTDFNYRAAEMAAKYKLILDLHGTHKPAGLNRTWPNVLNFEGVHGLEQMKWSDPSTDQMEYDVMIPFIRQVAGPMDYTQGAMLNAIKSNYRPCNSEPMSQGTRCHQLALYVVLDSPLNMLCDSPTNYLKESECTEFIAAIPTVWDDTKVLAGKIGEYIVTARRSGDSWYIGGITDWNARDIEVDLSALGLEGSSGILYLDGVNAHRKGSDYKIKAVSVENKLKVHLAPGGGFVLKVN